MTDQQERELVYKALCDAMMILNKVAFSMQRIDANIATQARTAVIKAVVDLNPNQTVKNTAKLDVCLN